MIHEPLTSVAFIICLGIFGKWLAWRLDLPSILPLLILGILAGPVLHLIDPDTLFGNMVRPIVSLSAALILYEGGLSLNFKELSMHGPVIKNLLSVGTLINWALVALAGIYILDLSLSLAILLGAIMIITGPTAMGPILHHAKLSARINSILKWEGIFNGPIGAMLVVIVFDAILNGELSRASAVTPFTIFLFFMGVLKFVAIGLIVGAVGAIILIQLFRMRLIPDFMQSITSLGFVFAFFLVANGLQKDSGLLAVTVMGLLIANQKIMHVQHIIQFKENLRLLLIATLFIVLAARLQLKDLSLINTNTVVYTLMLMFVARPVGVLIATRNSNLTLRERLFIGLLNPKGIVAASIAAIVAFSLIDKGYHNAELIIPITFFVITVTIITYSLAIDPVAKLLNLSHPNPQGVLIVGSHTWARELAKILQRENHPVLMVDTNALNIETALAEGISGVNANILSSSITDESGIEFAELGYLLALTPNDEVNSLTTVRLAEFFSEDHIYQLQPSEKYGANTKEDLDNLVRGHILFDSSLSFPVMTQLANRGATIEVFETTKERPYEWIFQEYGPRAIPLFFINTNNELAFYTIDTAPRPGEGCKVFVLIKPDSKND